MSGLRATIRWLFEDRQTGRLVVGQSPNVLALIVVASYAASLAVRKTDRTGPVLKAVATSSLSLWALDEVLRGVNPFRRIGGAAVLSAIAAKMVREQPLA